MNETWKDIPGYCGYQASTMGRIRSSRPTNGNSAKATFEDGYKIMAGAIGLRGYRKYTMALGEGCKVTRNGHVLVLEAFKGPRPPGMVARHLNDNKTDNRIENLEWGTQVENMKDCERNGNLYWGDRHPSSKIGEDSARAIKQMYAAGTGPAAIARRFGLNPITVRNVCWGRTWRRVA